VDRDDRVLGVHGERLVGPEIASGKARGRDLHRFERIRVGVIHERLRTAVELLDDLLPGACTLANRGADEREGERDAAGRLEDVVGLRWKLVGLSQRAEQMPSSLV